MATDTMTMRHNSIFRPRAFGNKRVDIIGVGAVGSRVACELARLGISNIHVWDHDTIAEHNIGNQIYNKKDVGQPKVRILQKMIRDATGTKITIHQEKVDGTQPLGSVVFVLTDSMSSRQQIWERGVKLKPRISVCVEARMGADKGRVYTVNPNNPHEVKTYTDYVNAYSDAQAQASACGAAITVGATASIIAGHAVWAFIRWFAEETGESTDSRENELLFEVRPPAVSTQTFNLDE